MSSNDIDSYVTSTIARLRLLGSDDSRVEVKSAAKGLPKSTWETVSAFANTEGGMLIFGFDEEQGFSPSATFDPEAIVNQIEVGLRAGADAKVTPPPPHDIQTAVFEDSPVVTLEVASLREDIGAQLPCFVTKRGIKDGSYKRVHDQDKRLSSYEIYSLQNLHLPTDTDSQAVPDTSLADLAEEQVQAVLRTLRSQGSRALDGIADGDMAAALQRINILTSAGDCTLAGFLSLSRYPQQRFPQLTVDVASYPTTRKSAEAGVRTLDRRTCDGPLPLMIEDAVHAVARNLKHKRRIVGAESEDVLEIPLEVLREAITNAVTHRDYSPLATGQQVAVDIYPDRVEVINPGGLRGTRTIANIDEGRSDSRNPNLAKLLTHVPSASNAGPVCENLGSGVPRMMNAMREHGLPTPDYTHSTLENVHVVLHRFGLLDPEINSWLASLPNSPQDEGLRKCLALTKRDGSISVPQLRQQLGLDSDVARDMLSQLVADNLLIGRGDGPFTLAAPSQTLASSGLRWAVLNALSKREARTIHEVAQETGKSPGTLRPVLRALVAAGLVQATAPPSSRNRAYLLASENTSTLGATDQIDA